MNSYRLSNIKRPVYSRPPELPVAPTATMPSPMTPAQTSPALFTPCAVDSLGSESVPTETSIGPPPISSFKFSSQNSNQSPPQIQPTVLPPSFANLVSKLFYKCSVAINFTVSPSVAWLVFNLTKLNHVPIK